MNVGFELCFSIESKLSISVIGFEFEMGKFVILISISTWFSFNTNKSQRDKFQVTSHIELTELIVLIFDIYRRIYSMPGETLWTEMCAIKC